MIGVMAAIGSRFVAVALGACLAMGYVTWAAHLDVPLAHVEVELQADFDVRGQYGQDEIRPGYTQIRCLVL